MALRLCWAVLGAPTTSGDHAYTLAMTDIGTGWTENRSVGE